MLLAQYRTELRAELQNILQFWIKYATDKVNGGYYGAVDRNNLPDGTADKGVVLNARILWTFSAAFQYISESRFLEAAQRTFEYINGYFWDRAYGGLFWRIDYKGNPLDEKKQIYAQAFAVYAFSEYYKILPDNQLKERTIGLYRYMQRYSYDEKQGGYLEAFTRQWTDLGDMRLSEKDENEKKTMNTHLHVLEAYTNLYRIWKDEMLKKHILELLEVFYDKILDRRSKHLRLFFDEQWRSKTNIVSYGHDIEASWLLLEAAEVIEEAHVIQKYSSLALQMVSATLEGLDAAGGLWYERKGGQLIKEKHWWVQAEAMVGFVNAYRLSGDKKYLVLSYKVWEFVKQHVRSSKGEWLWGTDSSNHPLPIPEKVGFWKCPYHNARACMEVIKKLNV